MDLSEIVKAPEDYVKDIGVVQQATLFYWQEIWAWWHNFYLTSLKEMVDPVVMSDD